MEKEANILKRVLATEPLLVRIDRSAYAPQIRRIADLQSWLVGPGVPYITVYRQGGSKSQPPTLRPPRTCFWYSMSSRVPNGREYGADSRTTLGRPTIFAVMFTYR
jgi:hypothetical protein